jgi:hypothetical protein
MTFDKNEISSCPRCGGAVFAEQNVHVCDPGEVELKGHMDRDRELRELKDSIQIHAHNAMIEWGGLKCEHSRMKLPVRFVLAMEELDRDMDKLRALERVNVIPSEGSKP